MKGTVPRVPLRQEVVDTILICITFFLTSIVLESWPFKLVIAACFIIAILEIFVSSSCAYNMTDSRKASACGTMTLILAIALVMLFMNHLSWKEYMLWLGVVTASDASGLLFGRLFGTHRPFFSKTISPNKTYEGYLGEIIGSITVGFSILLILDLPMTTTNIIYICTGFIPCAIGDLVGSAAKRELEIKDSSDKMLKLPVIGRLEVIMRSRHGYLDCFDSASFAFIYFIILIVGRS